MLHIFIYAYTYTWTPSLEIIQAPYLLVDSDFKIHIHTFSELLQCYWCPVNFQQSSLVWTYSQCINLTAHEEKTRQQCSALSGTSISQLCSQALVIMGPWVLGRF